LRPANKVKAGAQSFRAARLLSIVHRATPDSFFGSNYLLFPSPFDPKKPADHSAICRRLSAACQKLELGYVTPHGLRSYFVTRARESGLSDAEMAILIGDKTGPAIIAHTYGNVRPDHLLKQAQRIRLTATQPSQENSNKSSNTSSDVTTGFVLSR
jgi:integrase